MYFDDNLTVPTEYYKTYISDRTIWAQAEKIIEDSDEPAFIHCTTMQDHQPYDPETEEGGTVESTELSIAPGTMKTAIKIKANTDVMQPGMRYVLPLQIDYVSDYFAPGSGNLIYLEVNMAE